MGQDMRQCTKCGSMDVKNRENVDRVKDQGVPISSEAVCLSMTSEK